MIVLSFPFVNGKNKNRGKLDIVHEILCISSIKVRKTRIMYQANLSFVQVERYLQNLLENGLIEFLDDTFYLITPKGKRFLQMHTEYLLKVKQLGEEANETEKNKLRLENMCNDNGRQENHRKLSAH